MTQPQPLLIQVPGQQLPWYLDIDIWDADRLPLQVYYNDADTIDNFYDLVVCPDCGARWIAIVYAGLTGVECPYCGKIDEGYIWTLPATND